ncbi:flagellar export chaperone FliS [Simiduia agarivorans]|uniref:Flagellar secretion chaperone FliS n=1 Tax=Simiduia agarivorans (strain DSM 21679 / JCM 13881 / BCRC 17597 / SA1) TaxID=1117647 RepID=K4KF61_SIMAS|nr:flagellar export chaperone FliS [Simiduia agarivorans]AFU97679.1 flagellar protein FliS [Simiduia agarivorans SA1 = DSM 21679]
MLKPKSAELYRQLGLEAQITGASPHRLIGLLYAGAIGELNRAIACESQGQRQARINAIAKCVDILNGLLESLSFEVESDLPYRLESLYVYMIQRLLTVQASFDGETCKEVQGLLEVLADGWQQMTPDSA